MMNTPSPSRHERRRQQTRKLLIQTAVQLVLEKGYDAVSIQDITDRADLGRGTFYIHFKDKEEIVWSAIQSLILELEQEAHQLYKDGIPDQPEYYGLLYIFRHADQNRDLFRLIFSGRGSAVLTRRVQDLLAAIFLYDLRTQPFLRDPISDVPVEIVAQMTTGMITRMIDWWLDTSNAYSAEQMAAMMYKVLYHKQPPAIQP
jgi:AcrR family transcriptional regulator